MDFPQAILHSKPVEIQSWLFNKSSRSEIQQWLSQQMMLIAANQRDMNKQTRAGRIKKRWVEDPEEVLPLDWMTAQIFSDFILFQWRGLWWGLLTLPCLLTQDLFGWFFNIWPFLFPLWPLLLLLVASCSIAVPLTRMPPSSIFSFFSEQPGIPSSWIGIMS